MIKKLTKHGNSWALVIDKAVLELLNIDPETPLEIATDGQTLIVDLQLVRFAKLLEERDIRLEVTDAAKKAIASEGYDPMYGARPLKRVIQRSLQDKLANLLLEGRVHDGETVQITAGPDGLEVQRVGPARLAEAA